MKRILLLLLIALTFACTEPKNEITHLVFLDLKSETDIQEMIQEIEKMEAIAELAGLEVGTYKDLGDPRALSNFELIIYTEFKDSTDYLAYQKHPIHVKLREYLLPNLAGPPVTYDYNSVDKK